jgi:hypothetical protein
MPSYQETGYRMNERIRELAEQTGWAEHIRYKPTRIEIEKFAELIVQECAQVLWNIDSGELHDEYVESLKKHFGIE